MAEVQAQALSQVPCQPQCQPQCQPASGDMDFDVSRTFTLLMVSLVIPVYLAISVVSYSMAAIY